MIPCLPREGRLYVLDLCCGKSYLTFAAYWYLTSVMGREVSMVGADLKADVIAFCSDTAQKLGCSGLSFVCCDIMKFVPERSPDLVLSLHACDTATDIVLTTAARLGAKVILSTPCCQHQLMNDLKPDSPLGSALMPVMEQSLLKQKLCVALTDALRCKRLEAAGYSVTVTRAYRPGGHPEKPPHPRRKGPHARRSEGKAPRGVRSTSGPLRSKAVRRKPLLISGYPAKLKNPLTKRFINKSVVRITADDGFIIDNSVYIML